MFGFEQNEAGGLEAQDACSSTKNETPKPRTPKHTKNFTVLVFVFLFPGDASPTGEDMYKCSA